MICEAYPGQSPNIGEMTLDELYLLTCDRESLKRSHGGRWVTGTPGELEGRGIIERFDTIRGESVVQRIERSLVDLCELLSLKRDRLLEIMQASGVEGDISHLYIYSKRDAAKILAGSGRQFKRRRHRAAWDRWVANLHEGE